MKRTLNTLLALGGCTFVFLFGYSLISRLWVDYGHTSTALLLIEYPLVLSLVLLLYFPSKERKAGRKMALMAPFAPILALYVLFDLFYLHLDRTPMLSDLNCLPDFIRATPGLALSAFAIVVASFLPALIFWVAWLRKADKAKLAKTLAWKGAVLILLVSAFQSSTLFRFQKRHAGITVVRSQYDLKRFGRLASVQYHYSRALLRREKLKRHPDAIACEVGDYFWHGALAEKRNVHIVVMESFIDARRIHGADYGARSPLYPGLKKYLPGHGVFSSVISPVYGGGTCQSEFEVLSGLPAMSLIENDEFLCLNGSPIDSFVERLKQRGYRAVATIGASSRFFNSVKAYRSIGFDEVHFIDDHPYFAKNPEDAQIFDGDLLGADARRLREVWLKPGDDRPLVNYVLGFYGHCPIRKDTNPARPDVVHAKGEPAEVDVMANEFYYRTKAVSNFLDELRKLDPNGIVLIISDHLPFPPASGIAYDGDKRQNIALLLDRFSPVDISGKRYYEIPHVLWNLLRDDPDPLHTPILPAATLENLNCTLMMEGMGMRPIDGRRPIELAASPKRRR